MKIAKVQLTEWYKPQYCDLNGAEFAVGNQVVFKSDAGNEIGKIVSFEEIDIEAFEKIEGNEIKPILRKVTDADFEKVLDQEKKDKLIEDCRALTVKCGLDMKVVDVHQSMDGARLTFAFIADSRVDFRELVKELTRQFNRTIRLQQIGIRDEARLCGDCGHCGRGLCCKGHIRDFMSITSEMAEIQQCEHRGSDRISGACGRLMCCLAYEEKGYADMAKSMPPIGKIVNVDGKRGEVLSWQMLKRTVRVKFPDDDGRGYTITEVDLDRNKKN